MQVMMNFMKTAMAGPKFMMPWLMVLSGVNMVAPLFFLGTTEGKAVLAVFMVAMMILMAVFKMLGWVRLLGVAHFPWFWLLPWLWMRLDTIDLESPLGYWLMAVLVINTVSLAMDVVDVGRYLMGDRTPQYSLDA